MDIDTDIYGEGTGKERKVEELREMGESETRDIDKTLQTPNTQTRTIHKHKPKKVMFSVNGK